MFRTNASVWTSGEYRYDGAGNVVSIGVEGVPGTPGPRTYRYDAVGRLTQAQIGTAPEGTYEYRYDHFGNRTAYGVKQQWVPVLADPVTNRLSDATYDASGNQLARGSTSATFDGFGMVTSYRFDAVNGETFVYNASDERIGVLRGTQWTWSFRDEGGRVLRQYRSSSIHPTAPWIWVEDFVYRGELMLGSERAAAEGGRRHYHLDHLGSAALATSAAGSIIAEHEFLPFGEERTSVGQQIAKGFDREMAHRFTGHERDFDSAVPSDSSAYIDYMHARYYSARMGRFLSVDPANNYDPRDPQTWNRYSYTNNSPVSHVDPDGRNKKKPFAWIVKYVRDRHVRVRPLFSNKEAARALRQNQQVDFARRQDAVAAQRANSKGGRPVRDPAHPDPATGSTQGRHPHAHASGRPEGIGHASWGTALVGFSVGAFFSIFNMEADFVNETPDLELNEQYEQVALWVFGKSYDDLTQAERQTVNDTMRGVEPLPPVPHGNRPLDADVPADCGS